MNLPFDDVGSGNPVILLHAFPLSKIMWKQQSDFLAGNNFRVILPDLPGFGDNISSSSSLEETAAQLVQLLKYLEIDKAIIGGLSMGGYIAFNLFRLAPEKFSALILCDTTYLADTVEKQKSRFELISKIKNQGSRALVENMLPNLISENTKQNNHSLTSKLEEIFSKVNPASAIDALQSMAERTDNSDIVKEINVPTLLVFGENDKVTNLENARQMKSLIPHSELQIIENAGHYSNLEQPEQFNKILLDFCRRIEF
jgi:3-oxoadipate enol-lactonase